MPSRPFVDLRGSHIDRSQIFVDSIGIRYKNVYNIGSLLVSATHDDLQEYLDTLYSGMANTHILVKGLGQPAENLATRLQHIDDTDGFIGIYGFWYGHFDNHYDKSAIHIEFERAWERWRDADPRRMVIFKPHVSGPDFKTLKAIADDLAQSSFHGEAAEYTRRMGEFLRQIEQIASTHQGLVITFTNRDNLSKGVYSVFLSWVCPLAEAHIWGASAEGEDSAAVSQAVLGELRHRQFDAIEDTRKSAINKQLPAWVMVAHGNEDAGLDEFYAGVLGSRSLWKGRSPGNASGTLLFPESTIQNLIDWFKNAFKIPADEISSPEALADALYEQLEDQPLNFVLSDISNLSGGVKRFLEDFWQKLYTRLQVCCEKYPVYPLIGLILQHSDDLAQVEEDMLLDFDQIQSPADGTKLLRLPVLGDLTADDIRPWLATCEDLPYEVAPKNRNTLIEKVLHDAKSGEVDPIPTHVFDRLRQHTTWKGME